jgi:hypothetical protein
MFYKVLLVALRLIRVVLLYAIEVNPEMSHGLFNAGVLNLWGKPPGGGVEAI